MPESGMVAVAALETIVIFPVWLPSVVGLNVAEMVQDAPGAMVEGIRLQLSTPRLNCPLMLMLEMTRLAVPLLVTVTV
jgi:hypothetical protein